MVQQHSTTTQPCNMTLQHSTLQDVALTWRCTIATAPLQLQHGTAAWHCNMALQDGTATWHCSTALQNGAGT